MYVTAEQEVSSSIPGIGPKVPDKSYYTMLARHIDVRFISSFTSLCNIVVVTVYSRSYFTIKICFSVVFFTWLS